MQDYQRSEERLASLKSASQILSVTCQLFLMKENGTVPHGCIVLFYFNNNFYCFSNSHVLNRLIYPDIFFLGENLTPFAVEGDLCFTEPKKKNKNYSSNDTYDMAVLKLTIITASNLISNGYKFLIFENTKTSVNLSTENITMIASYPASKTKLKLKNKELKFNPLVLRTLITKKDCTKFGFPQEFHHIVEYPRKSFLESTTGKRIIAPKPHGMSGSGLWVLLGDSALDNQPYLIGVLSEYDENRSLIFSTKIDLFLSILKQVFDSTLPYEGIKVNLDVFV